MGKYIAAAHDHLVLPARAFLLRGQEQARRLLGRPIPAPVTVRLLIDTGSRRSTLLPSIVTHLELEVIGTVRVETGVAAVETELYWVRLEFPQTALAAIPELIIARMPLPPSLHAFHGLIGRDLLRRWESFVYQGRRGRFSIHDTPGWRFGWLSR
jgi:hypothetical protein